MDPAYKLASDQIIATTSSTLNKDNYEQSYVSTGPSLDLETKVEFDEERERRIQLYASRWEKGYECISGKPMYGEALKGWHEWRKFYKRKKKNKKNFFPKKNN